MPRRETAIFSRPPGVDLGDVGDLRRLAQELQELDAAQFESLASSCGSAA